MSTSHNRTAVKKADLFLVSAQVAQMTLGVHVCNPLRTFMHAFAYGISAGGWPFADKACSFGDPLVAG